MAFPAISGLSGSRALSGALLQTFSYGSENPKAPPCSVWWSFQPSFVAFPAAGLIPGLCSKLFLTVPRLPLGPFKTPKPFPAAPSGLSSHHSWPLQGSVRGFAPSFFLRFQDCRLAPSKPQSPSLQRLVAFPAHSWPFRLQCSVRGLAPSFFLLPLDPFKNPKPFPAAPSGLSSHHSWPLQGSVRGFAPSFFLRFQDCRLAPSKPQNPSLQRLVVFPAIIRGLSGCRALSGVLLQAFSYGSETATWPLQHLQAISLAPLPAASSGLSSHQWPFRLQSSVRGLALNFFLRFRDCRLAPSKTPKPLPAASSGLSSYHSCAFPAAGLCPGPRFKLFLFIPCAVYDAASP